MALVHAPVELLGEEPRLLGDLLQLLLYPVVILPVGGVVQVGEVAQHGKTWEATEVYYRNPVPILFISPALTTMRTEVLEMKRKNCLPEWLLHSWNKVRS